MLSITLEYLEKRLIVHLMTTVGGAGAQCIGCIQLIGQYINTFITQILKNLSAVKVHVSTVVGLFIINPETVFAQFVTPRLAKNYIIRLMIYYHQKKKIESLYIKATVNNFSSPCIMIPLITKSTKTNSKEYQTAFNLAHQILSAFDVITHNK